MAVRRICADGKAEVVVPPTPEEAVAEQAAIIRIAEALAYVVEEREWAARQREAALSPQGPCLGGDG